jgi:DNA-binding winged helix-turn-helix (wHTH) protein/tetratricopeptide (TPR) repeat protein
MNATSESHPIYRFGLFEAHPGTGALLKKGVRIKLQEQPFRLLCLLLENHGAIVSKDLLRERLWPANTFVEFDASLSVAVGKLRDALDDDAENPRFIETVPRRGYRFIAPVESIGAATPSMAHPPLVAPGTPPDPATVVVPSSKLNLKLLVALLICVVALSLGLIYKFHSPRIRPPSVTATPGNVNALPITPVRRSVAVLGFRNLPGRPQENWLSTAFSEMLNTELAEGGALRMVSGEDIARAKRELPLADEDTLAKATLEKLHVNPGADVVILGSYTTLPGKDQTRIRLDVRAQDTAAGETIAEESVTGSEDNLFELASQAGARLRQRLGMNSVSADVTTAARASLPSNQRALQYYSEGRAKLWQFDMSAAHELLVQAVQADPQYPLAHSALSETLWHQGFLLKARSEAKRAVELSGNLPEEERLLVEGQYRRSISDWPGTVDAYRALFGLFPDRLDYGLLLAAAQAHLDLNASLLTLAALRRLPPPSGDDARIDMTEASVWINHDFAKADAAARRALAKGTAQGSPAVVAWSYGTLCQQGVSSGKSTVEAIRLCEEARRTAISAKNPNGVAMAQTDLAGIRYRQGDITQAESMFEQALTTFRQIGNTMGVAAVLSNLGAVKLGQGELTQAQKLLEQSIPEYQALGDDEGLALAFNNLGDVARQAGQLDTADSNYRQAKVSAAKIDDKNALAYVSSGSADVLSDRGLLAAARKSYAQALALRTQLGEDLAVAETQLSLAQLSVDEGHPADAEVVARSSQQQFHNDQQTDDELAAALVLIDSLLAQGKYNEAKNEAVLAAPLSSKTQNLFTRLQFNLASARTLLNSAHPESAMAPLQKILQAVRVHGYLGLEFQARLVLAQLEKKLGHLAVAQSQLAALEKSATAKGFGLVARQASAARP